MSTFFFSIPLLETPFAERSNFQFDLDRVIFARLNRSEIGDRAALIIGLFLISRFKGQLIIPDFGFYGRDAHVSLIRENRLTAGVYSLAELSPKLRPAVLLIKDKECSGTTFDDAETLAKYAGLRSDNPREDNDYNRYIAAAMGA